MRLIQNIIINLTGGVQCGVVNSGTGQEWDLGIFKAEYRSLSLGDIEK